ncbi:NAD(P)-dependent dehydrogenase, short-chain alcohol dehydrogenase family [Paracoccus solventivorans]|uniref:NAD(P)-dependent dehydrogenase, short-chain alcohol dehydrogenase family n=1 Tax=Paracoccus solventivorans TaxID=53463 RepID=A0A1M7ISR4_9RHOB|nr:3-ketoacyl-ACP reductase [Paracoccus solventivorans]SHM43638.1 NAD(P)-dependent dehydrogenase, short-chain alcohol dehydrogenase family [Paracoccus solventivorans]
MGTASVALVTGAGGGLGAAIARALAGRGHDLVLNDLEPSERLEALAAELRALGVRVEIMAQDIAQVAHLPGYVAGVAARMGGLDVLVNNAGVSVLSRGDLLEVTPESFDRCIAVNLRAQFFLTQAVARHMLAAPSARRRAIVTITTVAVDHVVGRVLAEYSMSKAGLAHMVQHFAARLAPQNIDCFEIRPGMMQTPMTSTSREKYDRLIAEGFVPAGRWGELDEIGKVVATMASGEFAYAVGQTIHIDGGMRMKMF